MRQLILPTFTSDLEHLFAERAKLERSVYARNTEKSHAHDWKMFSAWCQQVQRNSLPATTETVSLYLTDLLSRGRKVSTAARRTSGITHLHRTQGYPSPVTEATWSLLAGAQRSRLERPRQMQPLDVDQVRRISGILATEGTAEAFRNRAVIVLGFTSALRRGSITDLLLSDLEIVDQGVIIRIRREKTDQKGEGRYVGVPVGKHPDTCLASCLKDWLRFRNTAPGPLFTRVEGDRSHGLSPSAVGRIVKDGVKRISLDPSKFSGHSLRAGFISAAAEAGVPILLIAAQSGHRSMDVLRRYFRKTDVWRANPCALLGL